jgi:hypothetical protein
MHHERLQNARSKRGVMPMHLKRYHSIEEFEREEIRADLKVGFSLDDLYVDANFDHRFGELDDDLEEFDFDE